MTEPRNDGDQRAEQAFRDAISELNIPSEVDPAAARHRVRRGRAAGLVAGAMVVLAGAVVLPQVVTVGTDRISVAASPAPSANGWRIEHYRDVTFTVPGSWGYAYANDDDCAEHQKSGYVSLGRPRVDDLAGCTASDGTGILDEHVAVKPLADVEPGVENGMVQKDGWWAVTSTVGEVAVMAVSRDKSVAERIVASTTRVPASSTALCPPHSVLETEPASRPALPFDVTRLRGVDTITVCQYDPVDPSVPLDPMPRDPSLPGQPVPSDPGKPAPSEPGKPVPADPGKPTIPVIPSLPPGPNVPENPEPPRTSVVPVDPDGSQDPGQPGDIEPGRPLPGNPQPGSPQPGNPQPDTPQPLPGPSEPPVKPAQRATSGLAGQATLTGSAATSLLTQIQRAEPRRQTTCPAPRPGVQVERPDLLVVLHLQSGATTHTMHVTARSCSDSGTAGGFDDGTTVREFTREGCRALLVPPIRLESAAGSSVASACFR